MMNLIKACGFSIAILLCCVQPAEAENIIPLSFESTPTQALVTVSVETPDDRLRQYEVLGQCTTPCSLNIPYSGGLRIVKMEKSGYKTKETQAFFIKENAQSKYAIAYSEVVNWTLEDVNASQDNGGPSVIEATPILREVPKYPKWLKAPESCRMTFDLNTLGHPENIVANCKTKGLKKRSVKAVKRWRYNPKTVDGVPVPVVGIKAKLNYKLYYN